jgi:hypothetical protein
MGSGCDIIGRKQGADATRFRFAHDIEEGGFKATGEGEEGRATTRVNTVQIRSIVGTVFIASAVEVQRSWRSIPLVDEAVPVLHLHGGRNEDGPYLGWGVGIHEI